MHQRREHLTDTGDLLSMLLLARDEAGQGMSDQQLRGEIIALLFAGQETTANALTWACALLASYPESERLLFEEVEAVLQGGYSSIEQVSQLRYTRMVLDETLRLYPPTFALVRRTRTDDTICGYRIAAGHMVWTNIYAVHHHPAYWEQPEVFDPERFSPEHPAAGAREAYFPFGGGPHLCIGNSFALLEGQLVLALLASRYQFQLTPGQTVEPMVALTIRPRYDLPLLLRPRG